MELKQLFLEQLEREAEASRKAVERVPEGRSDREAARALHALSVTCIARRDHARLGSG